MDHPPSGGAARAHLLSRVLQHAPTEHRVRAGPQTGHGAWRRPRVARAFRALLRALVFHARGWRRDRFRPRTPLSDWPIYGQHLRPESQGHAARASDFWAARLFTPAGNDFAERARAAGRLPVRRAQLPDRASPVSDDAPQQPEPSPPARARLPRVA